jgi:hypothetical protein
LRHIKQNQVISEAEEKRLEAQCETWRQHVDAERDKLRNREVQAQNALREDVARSISELFQACSVAVNAVKESLGIATMNAAAGDDAGAEPEYNGMAGRWKQFVKATAAAEAATLSQLVQWPAETDRARLQAVQVPSRQLEQVRLVLGQLDGSSPLAKCMLGLVRHLELALRSLADSAARWSAERALADSPRYEAAQRVTRYVLPLLSAVLPARPHPAPPRPWSSCCSAEGLLRHDVV